MVPWYKCPPRIQPQRMELRVNVTAYGAGPLGGSSLGIPLEGWGALGASPATGGCSNKLLSIRQRWSPSSEVSSASNLILYFQDSKTKSFAYRRCYLRCFVPEAQMKTHGFAGKPGSWPFTSVHPPPQSLWLRVECVGSSDLELSSFFLFLKISVFGLCCYSKHHD